MTPEEMAMSDQGLAYFADTMPSTLYRMYENLKKEGFNDDQSLILVNTFFIGLFKGNK